MLDTLKSFVLENIIRPWPIIITLLFVTIYPMVVKNWSYFAQRNVKFTRGPPILGTLWKGAFGIKSLPEDILDLYNHWPTENIIGFFEFGGKPKYFIRDPELIKQIAIKDFDHFVNHETNVDVDLDPMFGRSLIVMRDQRWRNMRATLSPAFTGSKMRLMFSLIGDVSQQFVSYLKNDIKTVGSDEFQMTELFARFANDAIASTAFGIDVNSLKDRDNEFYKTGLSITNFSGILNVFKFIIIFTAPKFVTRLLNLRVTSEKDTNYFRKIVHENMEYREKNGILRNDMINILMQVKKGMEIDAATTEQENDIGFATVQESTQSKLVNDGEKWTDDDLAAQCMIFVFAGFETVSLTLCFMAHELTVNPDVQERLYQEIVETKESLNGKSLTYEALQKMKYMDMVLSESMRMWSQQALSDRYVNKPYTLENPNGTKIQLEVGDIVVIPTHGLHRDPKWFPNPNKFDPERFSDDNKGNIVSGTYMPFGIGPRSCIASRFALMECKACMYYMLLDYSLEMSAKTQHPIILKKNSGGSLQGENGFWIKLKQRN